VPSEADTCRKYVVPLLQAVQKALPLMGEGGSIILTGSSAGTTGAPAMSAYSASKAAVRNLARTWAEDLKSPASG
jgi:NAD(P)-dependent dehydrogenase (short-subunit alcohol dehydrogenase family)